MSETSWLSPAGSWILGLCLFAACAGEPRPTVQPMHFDVDAERLGDRVQAFALGISFQPPKEWEPLSTAHIDSVSQVLDRVDAQLQPRHIFLHPTGGSLLSVALLPRADSVTFEEQMAVYGQRLAQQAPSDSLRQGAFLKDGIHIVQFLSRPPGIVHFTLVFEAASDVLIQFDYVVPQQQYAMEVKAVESSIGSIQRLE